VLLAGALLAKGPQGLFPLIVPVVAPLCLPGIRWRAARVAGLAMAGALVSVIGILLLWDGGAREAFRMVTMDRIVMSLTGQRELSLSRWHMLKRLVADLAVPVGIALLATLLTRRFAWRAAVARASFFAVLGCAGSLPFLLSPIQFARYLVPSLPFFAAGVGAFFEAAGARIERAVAARRAWRLTVTALSLASLVLAVGIMLGRAGSIRRDVDFHRDLPRLPIPLEPRPLVSVCPARLATWWPLVAHMQRVHGASLTAAGDGRLKLVEAGADCSLPAACVRLQAVPPRRYALYRCPARPL
jgi:hypothetical protein